MSESLVPSEHQPLTLAKPSGVPAVLTGTTFLAFLWSVRSHWVTLMGGGAITVGLGLIERFSGKNVPRWIYGGVIVGFVFWAAYLTWRDTKQRLIQREVKLKNALEPKLRISFEERSPFIDPYETDAHLAVLFRVKVFSSIFGVVRVKVEEVEMEGRGFADIYLRPTNKDQGQNQTEM